MADPRPRRFAPASVLHIAGLIAVLTLLAKGFGFGRELVIADVFGAGLPKDAYTYAYLLPAFALVMLGGLNGPFHSCALTALTRMEAMGQQDQSPGVIATLCLGTAALMGLLSLVVFLAAPDLIHHVIAPAAPAAVTRLATAELQIMSPLLLMGGLIGVLSGVGNARGQFILPSLSPLMASLSVIFAVLVIHTPIAMAWGTLVGACGQLLLQTLPLLPRPSRLFHGRLPRPVPFDHLAVRDAGTLLLPAVLSSSVGTINVNIGLIFASTLAIGSASVFDYANKLLQLPLGVLLTALLVPLLPVLTTAVSRDDRPTLHLWMNRGIQTVAIATLPMTVGAIVLGQPLIRTLFQHGAFTAQATHRTYLVLAFSAVSLTAYAWRDLLTRVFYAMNDSRRPLLVSVASIGFNLLFNFLLVHRYGVVGLASAYSLVTVTNLALMAYLLRRRLGSLQLASSLPTVGKCVVAAILAGLVCWQGTFWVLAGPHSSLLSLLRLVLLGGLLLATYVGTLVIWRVPLVENLWRRSPLGAA